MPDYISTYQNCNNFFDIDNIGEALNGKRNNRGGYDLCDCPAHGGHKCLSTNIGANGELLLCCHAGCDFTAIISALRDMGLLPERCPTRPETPEERRLRKEKLARQRAEEEAKQAAKRDAAAKKAKAIYERADADLAAHPYSIKKRLPLGPLVRRGYWEQRKWTDALIVPLFDSLNLDAPSTLQAISPDGEKDYLAGGPKRGCFHIFGQPANGALLHIGEGLATVAAVHHATGHACLVACDAPNLPPVAANARRLWPTAKIVLLEDHDDAGRKFAANAARAVGGQVARAVDGLPNLSEHGDFWDVWNVGEDEAVQNALNQAREPEREETQKEGGAGAERETSEKATDPTNGEEAAQAALDREIVRLAALTPARYEQERKTVAKTLDIRAGLLDRMVKEEKAKAAPVSDLPFEETVPCAEPVNPAELLDDIEKTIRRFIICAPEIATAATLWVAFTWFIGVVQVAPIALITAPEKECGKSTMLDILADLSARAMTTSNISAAALFRVIEKWHPTLLIDEADAFMRDNEDLRCIINSGHKRKGAYVIRCVGDDHDTKQFRTWGAKAIAGIGKQADTIMSRSIVLELRRKLPTEKVDSLSDAEETDLFPALRARLARFAENAKESVRSARPAMPETLGNRQRDNWKPLVAIADVAGGRWPELARRTALALSGRVEASSDAKTELLADIKTIFQTRRIDRISTAELLDALCADEEAPWATWNRGREITSRQVARMLKEYGIKTNATIRFGSSTAKGYLKADFEDVFARYLSEKTESAPHTPIVSVTTSQHNEINVLLDNSSVTPNISVTDTNQGNILKSLDCDVVTHSTPLSGAPSLFEADGTGEANPEEGLL